MPNQDDMNDFKEILTKLPEDKRKLLYQRLHDMPASEREAFIAEFAEKYRARQKAKASSPVKEQKEAVIQKEPEPVPEEKEVEPAESEEAPVMVIEYVEDNDPDGNKPAAPDFISDDTASSKKKNKAKKTRTNAFASVAIGLFSAVLIVGILYFVYAFNKPKVDGKFNEMLGVQPTESIDIYPETSNIMGPEPRHYPTDTPTPTPTPTPVPLREDHPDLTGLVIVLDPGHQEYPNSELEESIPGSTAEKEKASAGAVGVDTGAKEYELTLHYAVIMKDYLEQCGATVILTRTENDVNISNIERAKTATDNNADYFIRLHADSAPSSDISGVKVYVPSSGKHSSNAKSSGAKLADLVSKAIGSKSLGAVQSNMYTGLNHADSIKSYQLVIGYLSNSDDDALLSNEETAINTAGAVAEFLRK